MHEVLDRTVELAEETTNVLGEELDPGRLVRDYYRQASPEDVIDRSSQDVFGAVMSHARLARSRPAQEARVRVSTPTDSGEGWSANGHTVVEVVTDDMPFLVDSVTMAVEQLDIDIHCVVHPQLLVRRDDDGALVEVLAEDAERAGGDDEPDVQRESWIHVEIDRETDEDRIEEMTSALHKALSDVRDAVEDWGRMHDQVDDVVERLDASPPDLPEEEVDEAAALLRWLADDHFTFLGYREYELASQDGSEVLRARPGTGLGILRVQADADPERSRLPREVGEQARERTLLVLAKANSRATVHRPAYLDYVGVKVFDDDGAVVGERRFLGLFSSTAYTESLTRIPVVRRKARYVIDHADVDPVSHAGKALMDVLENYPREELFTTPADELAPVALAVMRNRERRQVRLFIRPDRYARYLSCLVYLPRDRYNTAVREKISAILKEHLQGDSLEYTARVNESFLARLHIVVRHANSASIPEYDQEDIERRLVAAARSWRDDFLDALDSEHGEERGAELARRYAPAVPDSYQDSYAPRTASVDVGRLDALEGEDALTLSLAERMDARPGEARLKLYRRGRPLSLSNVLPVLTDLGVEVVDEHPYAFEGLEHPTHLYDFGLRTGDPIPSQSREHFQEAMLAVWEGRCESDGFNALVLAAGLTWRQVMVLRAYAKYMRQGGTPFGQDYLEETLAGEVEITRLLVELFETRFDPTRDGDAGRTRRGRDRRARAHRPRPGAGLQPRQRPHPAVLPDRHLGDVAHELLPGRDRGRGRRPGRGQTTCRSSSTRPGCPTCLSRVRASRSSCTRRGWRACTCASARSPGAGCAGRTVARTSAPRCWGWSRRRW